MNQSFCWYPVVIDSSAAFWKMMQFIQYVSSARLVNSTGAALQKYIIIPILFVHGSQHLVEGSSLKDKMLAALFPGHRTTACIYALCIHRV